MCEYELLLPFNLIPPPKDEVLHHLVLLCHPLVDRVVVEFRVQNRLSEILVGLVDYLEEGETPANPIIMVEHSHALFLHSTHRKKALSCCKIISEAFHSLTLGSCEKESELERTLPLDPMSNCADPDR